MKSTTTTLLLSSLATLTTAQYSGSITTENRGSCPIPIREGDDTKFSWEPENGNLCIELGQGKVYTESYHASLTGYAEIPGAVEPGKFGACADSQCTDCVLVDIKRRTDRPGAIGSDCAEFENAPFLFVGVPVKDAGDL
ncbi:hypothetical protein BJX76DRAFT_339663 [Aspergillus varians]